MLEDEIPAEEIEDSITRARADLGNLNSSVSTPRARVYNRNTVKWRDAVKNNVVTLSQCKIAVRFYRGEKILERLANRVDINARPVCIRCSVCVVRAKRK